MCCSCVPMHMHTPHGVLGQVEQLRRLVVSFPDYVWKHVEWSDSHLCSHLPHCTVDIAWLALGCMRE